MFTFGPLSEDNPFYDAAADAFLLATVDYLAVGDLGSSAELFLQVADNGINYKDDPASARRFLGHYGNPFLRVGADRTGRTAIDWGVYGVPETYIVTGDGEIAYRHVGPLTDEAIRTEILPRVLAADGKPSG